MWYTFDMSHVIKESHYHVHVGVRGRVVLPAEVRKRLGLQEGDRLILTVAPDGSMRLVSASTQARHLKGLFKHVAPDRDLAQELIDERRQEAQQEAKQ